MKIIEHFTASKTGNNDLNEDSLVMTTDFVGVLDGVTSRGDKTLNGMTSGRFAAQTVTDAIHAMDANLTAREAVIYLNAHLEDRVETVAAAENMTFDKADTPATALLLYSKSRKEIWSIADSPFLIDGVLHEYPLLQEKILIDLRAFCLEAELAHGKTEEELRHDDPTWDSFKPMMARTRVFANFDGRLGFGVLTGDTIPDSLVKVVPANDASEIVMASDGYLKIAPTWEMTEKYLQDVITQDPLMYKINPQAKGVKTGNVSFDDRSYVRIGL